MGGPKEFKESPESKIPFPFVVLTLDLWLGLWIRTWTRAHLNYINHSFPLQNTFQIVKNKTIKSLIFRFPRTQTYHMSYDSYA